MTVSDTAASETLEDKNAKLKPQLSDTMLDKVVLKYLLEKN